MTDDNVGLVCARLIDMKRRHPRQDNSHKCNRCGARVGIYPAGQKQLQRNPKIEIVCYPCMRRDAKPQDKGYPAGSLETIRREIKESFSVEDILSDSKRDDVIEIALWPRRQ